MKQYILLCTCLSFSSITFSAEGRFLDFHDDKLKSKDAKNPIVHTDFENHLKDRYKALSEKDAALKDQKKALDDQNKVLADSSLPKKEKNKKINDAQTKINDAQQRIENAQKRADDAQQKARDEYEQRHNNGLSTRDFVDQNINMDHTTSIYGLDKDSSSKQISTDLFELDPHLFKEYNDKAYAIKPKLKKLTNSDFQEFEKYPGKIIDTSHYVSGEYSGKQLRLSPLEESIELKDKDSIDKILTLIKDPSFQEKAKNDGYDITLRSVTQPIIDKYITTLREKGIKAASEYVQSIEDIGVPELTKSINRQTAMLYLQWSLADGDIETAKNILSHIRNLKIKTSFIADELTKRYDYLKKYKGKTEANSFAQKIEKLGDAKLNAEFGL